jgi:hypothetical protein
VASKRIQRSGADTPLIVVIRHPLFRKRFSMRRPRKRVYNTYRCRVSTDLQRLLRFFIPGEHFSMWRPKRSV